MNKTILALTTAVVLAAPAFGVSDLFRFEAQATELDNISSATQLYERLDSAVMDYCFQLVDESQRVTCHAEVLASVVEQFDNETLTSIHFQATGLTGEDQVAARETGA